MWTYYNPNPDGGHVNDCSVRAVAKAMNKTWEEAYAAITLYGYIIRDMPSANRAWGEYLKRNGYKRHFLPNTCPDCYTVKDFCRDNPIGTYVIATDGHVVTAVDGDYYDTWDSGNTIPIYFWAKG